ncbi:hypothetical protein HBH61_015100 [Parastagonospora nodorum]|nr:hypothetical protein HBH61_015100 [Parastagonospora nodorum]
MLKSSIILGLSACAFALNVPRVKRYSESYSSVGYESTSTAVVTPVSSQVSTSTLIETPSSSITTRSPAFDHSISVIAYSTSDGDRTSPKPSPTGTPDCAAPYWLENIKHQGLASFNDGTPNNGTSFSNGTLFNNRTSFSNVTSYRVFRNVKDYGAKGDGITDDTAAINRAMTDGNRCAPSYCESSTITPAIVYFPGGTYVISRSIIDYYYTQMIGNPNCLPVIQASANFTSSDLGLIDGSPYLNEGPRAGGTGYGATTTFFRQIRNLILDMTLMPANVIATGIHWPTAQTTSLQNIVINMSAANGTLHQGILVEAGSAGFMTDLVFNGGKYGLDVGNQQYTNRNLTFNNVETAINQLWDWGWTYTGLTINNCRVGLNLSGDVGSITLFDSEIINTPVGIQTVKANSELPAAGSIYLENVKLENVRTAVLGPNATYLAGSSDATVIDAWAYGHRYLPNGPRKSRGHIAPSERPADLLDASGNYYVRSKPQYDSEPLTSFLSARDMGCTGDGKTDDTKALNGAILKARGEGKILFMDAGYYLVTDTIYIPPDSKIVGEALATVILSSGSSFNDMQFPRAVVQVAQPGEEGSLELSDLIVSTQGPQQGAILIQYNLRTIASEPSGLWDVHTRIGGFKGSNLQGAQCEKTPNITITASTLQKECIAAYMSMHVTKFASGLYMENNWLWTSDHDLDYPYAQLTLYAGRGLLIESLQGRIWLYGTAVEHHVKYEYQFVDTRNIFMGQVQTETAYYQPNPDASLPFPEDKSLSDPVFTPSRNSSVSTADGWGMRILRSNNILGYGMGLYSFFNNYNTTCNARAAGSPCQTRILSIEGQQNSYSINIYNLNTVGAGQMITRDGVDLARNLDNNSTFVDTINVFRINEFGA